MAYIAMAYMVMADIAMAYMVKAYIVKAFLVMAIAHPRLAVARDGCPAPFLVQFHRPAQRRRSTCVTI